MSNLSEKFKQKIEETNNLKNIESSEPIHVMAIETPVGDPEVIRTRHEESVKKYPQVKVDEDEYVIMALRRHSIGLVGIILTVFVLFVSLVSSWILICFTPNKFEIAGQMKDNLSLIFGSLSVLVIVAGYIGYSTYTSNRLFITNERAVQWIVRGLLDRKNQVINLESVEDISFLQTGILQHIFNYGTVRMSTTGDESTYTFHLTKSPAKVVEILGEISECARENQPISDGIMQEAKKMS